METKKTFLFWILIVSIVVSAIVLFFLFTLKKPSIPSDIVTAYPQLSIAGFDDEIESSGIFNIATNEEDLRIRLITDIKSLDGDYICDLATFNNSDTTIIRTTQVSQGGNKNYQTSERKKISLGLDVPTKIVLKNGKINESIKFNVSFEIKFPAEGSFSSTRWVQRKLSKDYELFLVSPEDFQKFSDIDYYNSHRIYNIIIALLIFSISSFLIVFRKKWIENFSLKSEKDVFFQIMFFALLFLNAIGLIYFLSILNYLHF